MTTHKLRLYDRSRVTTDWTCARKRYWNYEYKGRGIVPATTQYEFYFGSLVHDGLAAIASHTKDAQPAMSLKGQLPRIDINLIATTAHDQMFTTLMEASAGEDEYTSMQYANEQASLVEGMLRGFYKHVWPQLMQQYPIIRLVEEEMIYEHGGLTFMSRPDLVLQDLDGQLWYLEYKTTSSKSDSWINSWNTAVQLHSSIRAIERTLGEKVTGVIVQGLYKGYQSYNKQNSPYCYAYTRRGNPPFSQDETVYEYKAGFKKSPVWEMKGGVAAWIDEMPDSILSDQFPTTPPILIKDDMIDAFFSQRDIREREIANSVAGLSEVAGNAERQLIMDMTFPQKFESCYPSFGGKPCTYRNLCFGGVSDPLSQGYQLRESHHAAEAAQHAEAEAV